MAEQATEKKEESARIIQGRSPAYPYIPLGKAVERADQIRAAGAARTALPPETFYKIWEIGAQSSGARQTMAALNHFDLVEYIGRGDDRKVKLSDLALRIVLDKQPTSPERSAAIQQAALSPAIHKDLYDKYGGFLPADVVLETYLVRDRGYNEGAAQNLVDEYKSTLNFAELDEPANMSRNDSGAENPPPSDEAAVGDLVQIEISGAFQLEKPKRVRAIQEGQGRKWVFIEGSETGVPMEQVIVQQKALEGGGIVPPRLPEETRTLAAPPGMKEEKNSLDEGEAVLIWPENLSPDSVRDLEYWLKGILMKAKRRAGLKDDEAAN